MSERSMIAIVGNAPPGGDVSAFVDGSHLVVRINNATHYASGLLGKRTDVLFCRPTTHPHGWLLCNSEKWRIPQEVVDATELFITLASRTPLRYSHVDRIGHNRFLQVYPRLRDVTRTQLEIGIEDAVRRGTGLTMQPTLGCVAIWWALSMYPDSLIGLAGWGYTSCRHILGHDYDCEQRWIESLVISGRVVIL